MTDVPLRVLSTSMVIHEVKRGRPVVYVTFSGYDAVAHHAGPGRPDGFGPAERIDRSIGHILDACAAAKRPYDLVVLSDHGQSLGPTFRQLYGRTLVQLIASQIEGATSAEASRQSQPGRERPPHRGVACWPPVSGLPSRPSCDTGQAPAARWSAGSRIAAGAPLSSPADAQIGDVVVCASGNLGLIYLVGTPSRMTSEGIEMLHPGLIDALVAHPGIGLVVTNSNRGLVAVGRAGTRYLDDDRFVGDDPLSDYGPWASGGLATLGRLRALRGHHRDRKLRPVKSAGRILRRVGGLSRRPRRPSSGCLHRVPGWMAHLRGAVGGGPRHQPPAAPLDGGRAGGFQHGRSPDQRVWLDGPN